MRTHPYMQTASGIAFDLVAPTSAMVDFADIAQHLGKIARFAGATPGHFYSVAEHCVRAADAAFAATGNFGFASYVLLHDAHEAYIVDRITPEKLAEEVIALDHFGEQGAAIVTEVPKLLRYRIDKAIHDAAGLPWAPPSAVQVYVKRIDRVMLATERRDLMRASEVPWASLADIEPLPDHIFPWSWPEAWRLYGEAVRKYLPVYREGRA